MAIKSCPLSIDKRQHETDNRGTPMFPCAGYITTVGDNIIKLIPWHWHEEVEVMIVTKGSLKLDIPNRSIIIKEGEGAFINSSILQMAVNADVGFSEVKSFVFNPLLISGSIESVIGQKYVRPLVDCSHLNLIHFQKNFPWHKDAIHCIEEAFMHYQEGNFGYELLVRDGLSKLWFLIVNHYRSDLERQRNSSNLETTRAKTMLSYIHAHYADQISAKDIADSAIISERECLRCFNKVFGTSPMKYLLNHRISVAGGLLINSEFNITEICSLTGFESPSYFSLKFKALTGMTPSEYRQQGHSRPARRF